MSNLASILKQGETINLGAGTTFGVNENVVFTSSNPALVTVDSNGLVSVAGNPEKTTKVFISAKSQSGIPLGSYLIRVVPSAVDKNSIFKTGVANKPERFGKVGSTKNFVVDKGNGPHVGITYSSTDPSAVSVSATGEITFLKDVTLARQVFITAKDAENNIISSMPLVVLPSGVSGEKASIRPSINVTIGETTFSETRVVYLKYGQQATITADIGDGPNVGILYFSASISEGTVNNNGVVTPVVNPPEGEFETFVVTLREVESTAVLDAVRFFIVPSTASGETITDINSGNLVIGQIEDVSNPVGGSLDLAIEGAQLTVNFELPTDPDSEIWKAYLSIQASDGSHKLLPRTNIVSQVSPLVYDTAIPGKSYVATLKTLNRDGLSKVLTATVESQNGWNVAAWNTAGYGL